MFHQTFLIASCSWTVKNSLSSDKESSDINDIEKSSSILQNQNAAEYRHEPCNKTDDDLVNYLEYNLFNLTGYFVACMLNVAI